MKTPNRKRKKRIQVIVPRDELLAIEAFRFQSRMPSRAAAVRELLRRGMASTGRKIGERRGRRHVRPELRAAVARNGPDRLGSMRIRASPSSRPATKPAT